MQPRRYIYLIMDLAGLSAYRLPHFAQSKKAVKGCTLNVRVIGAKTHGPAHYARLYPMEYENETGENHVIEKIYCVTQNQQRSCLLPTSLLAQAGNCTRRNRNRFILAYLEKLCFLESISLRADLVSSSKLHA